MAKKDDEINKEVESIFTFGATGYEKGKGKKPEGLKGLDTIEYASSSEAQRERDRKLSEGARAENIVSGMQDVESPEKTYARAAGETYQKAKEATGGFISGLGSMFEKKDKGRTYQEAEEELKREQSYAGSQAEIDRDVAGLYSKGVINVKEFPSQVDEKTGKELLPQSYGETIQKYEEKQKEIQDANFRKLHDYNPLSAIVKGSIAAKSTLSDTKLRWEASKYGISPAMFDELTSDKAQATVEGKGQYTIIERGPKGGAGVERKVSGRVYLMYLINQGREREMKLKASEQAIKASQAVTRNVESSTALRYSALERQEAEVPKGGRKLVQFGWEEGSFGQVPTYMNARGIHGQIRSQFLPGQAAGVKTALARNRLAMAQMKATVVPRSYGKLEVRLPGGYSSEGEQPPSPQRTIALLSPNKGSGGYVPRSGFAVGPSILQKLGAIRRRR